MRVDGRINVMLQFWLTALRLPLSPPCPTRSTMIKENTSSGRARKAAPSTSLRRERWGASQRQTGGTQGTWWGYLTKGTWTVRHGNMVATKTPCLCEMDKHQWRWHSARRSHPARPLEQSGVYIRSRAKGCFSIFKSELIQVLFFLSFFFEKAKNKNTDLKNLQFSWDGKDDWSHCNVLRISEWPQRLEELSSAFVITCFALHTYKILHLSCTAGTFPNSVTMALIRTLSGPRLTGSSSAFHP